MHSKYDCCYEANNKPGTSRIWCQCLKASEECAPLVGAANRIKTLAGGTEEADTAINNYSDPRGIIH